MLIKSEISLFRPYIYGIDKYYYFIAYYNLSKKVLLAKIGCKKRTGY